MSDTGFATAEDQRDRIVPRYRLDENLRLQLAADQSAFPTLAGNAAGVKPNLLSIADFYSTAQDYMLLDTMPEERWLPARCRAVHACDRPHGNPVRRHCSGRSIHHAAATASGST